MLNVHAAAPKNRPSAPSARQADRPTSSWERFPLSYRLALAMILPVAGMGVSLFAQSLRGTDDFHEPASRMLVAGIVFTVVSLAFAARVAAGLLGTLRRLTDRLASAGREVGTHSESLSTAGYKLSSGATEAASSLEETASSIEELSSMVRLTAESAREASELSQASRASAEEGEKRIHGLITSMQTMAQQSKRIEDIITLIDDVAFQTNLLALNAAVEAARAGEQGKGFAVVAEAVRSLASKSAEAARDIGRLVRETVGSIEAGSTLAADSEHALREIVGNVRKVADLNNRIASANQEQANGIEQITQAVNQLDAATQVNAASAEQAAASANDLADQADALDELVTRLSFLAGRSRGIHLREKIPAAPAIARTAPRTAPRAVPAARVQSAPAIAESTRPLKVRTTPEPRNKPATVLPLTVKKKAENPVPGARKSVPASTTAESLLPLPGDPSPGARTGAGPIEVREARDQKLIPLAPAPGPGKTSDPKPTDPDELVSPLGSRKALRDPRKKRFSNLSGF